MSHPSVFISYSHKDKKWVKDYLLTNLEKNGIPCYIDFRDFTKGLPSSVNMEKAVEATDKAILVFTEDWFSSENTQFEAAMLQVIDPAGAKGKIIPILLKKGEIPLRFKIYTYYDFTDDNKSDSVLNELIGDLKQDVDLQKPEKKTYPTLDAQHIDTKRLPQTGFELFGRQKEQTLLNEAWESGATNIISFVAYGGVGKSTLVNKWVEKMRWDNYRGAEKVYAWSFYSQGTSERVTSADTFINETLQWFGDTEPEKGSPWDKGKRLARLINNHKTLLILDGLEPLQAAEKVEKGKIKDPALATLITELAKNNKGLCVITTREHVPELDRYTKKTIQKNLELISDEAGRKLLETRRISGSEQELERVVQQFGNHALAINLLAEYLRIFKNHPLEKANSIPNLNIPNEQGKHARRIIEAFANHFGEASAEYQLLSILGLFDRPVPIEAIAAILDEDPITGLPDKITDTSGSAWLTILGNLRKHKLIFEESEHNPDSLDCHPLIREHFGDKLQQQNPNGWKQAHARLYDYYKNLPEKELPDTLEEMEPLFAAVLHGCLAGKHQKAMDDVYWNRIRRQNEAYTVHKLGAFGADLSCLSNFFESLWDKPASGLAEADRAVTLSWAGFRLRAVGRLSEAAQPIKAGLEMSVEQKDWPNSSQNATNLSELYLTLGDLASAQKYGAQSMTFADRSGKESQKIDSRTAFGDALHQLGNVAKSQTLFNDAESIIHEIGYSHLFAIWGFRFNNLFLDEGEYEEVINRTKITKQYALSSGQLHDISLENLSRGKALMYQAVESSSSDLTDAEDYLKQAVNGLREANRQYFLPHGLFACAALFKNQKDFLKSWADLDEAWEIAEYGQMKLHLTDYHLEACRLIRSQLSGVSSQKKAKSYEVIENGETLSLTLEEMQARFQEHFEEAERLVKETGYHRRDGELEELRIKN